MSEPEEGSNASLCAQVSVRAVVDGVEENSDDTWEDPRGRGRRGRGGREGGMGRRGPPGQQEEEKEYAVSCWHPCLASPRCCLPASRSYYAAPSGALASTGIFPATSTAAKEPALNSAYLLEEKVLLLSHSRECLQQPHNLMCMAQSSAEIACWSISDSERDLQHLPTTALQCSPPCNL